MHKPSWVLCMGLIAGFLCFAPSLICAEENAPPKPLFYLNDKPEIPTVQDLGGVGTRPLRKLVARNNETHQDQVIQVYAMGTRKGDDLRIEMGALPNGMRVTLYKLFRDPQGKRSFTMPLSVFSGEAKEAVYREKIVPYRSEYLIVAYEKTVSKNNKSANLFYFEDRIRDLLVKSIKPNLSLTSIKLKMKDAASDEKSFTMDAQELIDRFINPQRIFVIRLWSDERAMPKTVDSL
jgi:hypothetical protein